MSKIKLNLENGSVVINLREDIAPKHTARITELVSQGFYDGVKFHRVIEGFMAQTGDPLTKDNAQRPRWGTGGSGQLLEAEFNTSIPFNRGTVGMARGADPHSADSQFFICFQEAPHLKGGYTVVGEVESGMEVVDQISRGAPPSGSVANPDAILSAELV